MEPLPAPPGQPVDASGDASGGASGGLPGGLAAPALVAEAIGELMGFWNFKPSLGRVWTVLYLSPEPIDAEEIERLSGLSSGNVSISLQELMQWGAVRRAHSAGRRRLFEVETDIWMLVARVFRERELRLVGRTISQLELALQQLDAERSSDPAAMLKNRFLVTRVTGLLDLSRTGYRLIDRLSRTGSVSLRSIRDVLLARRGPLE